ncbi:SMP-30/gluconolactonase/LRE family protein [Mesorhizobium sp. KR9-304]|uniref:SMP-30/gluconolactonase/LRE family protein n=1 Tax=Mesorhizobium sp. KR9-304 TaxID=3156614 RepID=UPI0032B35A22
MSEVSMTAVETVATGLGWPEGPTVLPDGRIVLVESYRSQLTAIDAKGKANRFAYVAGAPNSCVLGSDGALYVCQNGGTTGPWRASEMTTPSIQRVVEGGKAEIILTEVDGIKLNGPNDLVFAADGRLIFTDPGTYNPKAPDPSYIFALLPDGSAKVVVHFKTPTFPNGLGVEADGSIVWAESYTGRVCRQRPDGRRDDLGKLPGDNPIPDGMKVGADGRLYVTDIFAGGIHVLNPDGTPDGFIRCGKATTNCVFDGETLWITNAGVLADGSDPSFDGTLCRTRIPRGGRPTYHGRIAGSRNA